MNVAPAALCLAALTAASPLGACQTALLLAMDVSNSVDAGEFRLQTEGLAAALQAPEIIEILVRDRVSLSVMQWSGIPDQEISIGWTTIYSPAQVAALAAQVREMPRAFILSDTAPAEALIVALDHITKGPDCVRRVIDLSGDGTPNALGGAEVRHLRRRAERAGVTINGLAIESLGLAITNFYHRQVITGDGFVETAHGYRDYARAIRRKMLREISRVFG